MIEIRATAFAWLAMARVASVLAGGALYLAQGIAAAFGSGWGPLMAPLALQEIALGIWLIVKGFAEVIVADATASRSRYCHGRSGQGGLGH